MDRDNEVSEYLLSEVSPESSLLAIDQECGRWRCTLCALLLVTWSALIQLYGVCLHILLLTLLLPLRLLLPRLYWRILGYISKFTFIMLTSPLCAAGYTVYDVGDNIRELGDDVCLFLVNRPSYFDPLFLLHNFSNKGRSARNTTWVQKTLLRWSHIGVLGWLRGDYFLHKPTHIGIALDNLQLRVHLQKSARQRDKKWIILFPEGGLLFKHWAASREFAREQGYPVLNNVLLPRLSEVHQVLTTLGSGQDSVLKWVVDVTLAYEKEQPRSLCSCLNGQDTKCDVIFHYRIYPASQVPSGEDQLRNWLYERYQEKDKLLEHFIQTGYFPGQEAESMHDSSPENILPSSNVVPANAETKLNQYKTEYESPLEGILAQKLGNNVVPPSESSEEQPQLNVKQITRSCQKNLNSGAPQPVMSLRKIKWPHFFLSLVLHLFHFAVFVFLFSALGQVIHEYCRPHRYW